MGIQCHILVFGKSAMLGELATALRLSPLLQVVERKTGRTLGKLHPDVIVVDGLHVTPEQFSALIAVCPSIISVDPDTRQLTIFSSPHHATTIAEVARVVGILSFTLRQPA